MKLIHCILIFILLISSCGNRPKKEQDHAPPELAGVLFDVDALPQEPLFDIETTDGTLRIKLYKETPGHRDNFVQLCANRYYDGVIFHRVIKDFMIQAGNLSNEPTKVQLEYGDQEGVNYTIPAEIVPGLKHKRGSLAAARLPDRINPEKASSGSQFYIVQHDNSAPHLDGGYTIFGEVIDGFEVIDKIADEPVNADRPIKEIKIISIKPIL